MTKVAQDRPCSTVVPCMIMCIIMMKPILYSGDCSRLYTYQLYTCMYGLYAGITQFKGIGKAKSHF